MEFKFRAIDKQPSTYQPQSSSFTYFTEQAIRVGNYNADFGRNREFLGNQHDVREAIRRELEKERIREEIIAAEIARKRALEAEVRMEMMIEEELALRRGDSFSYPPVASRFDPRLSFVHQSQGVRSLEERIAFSLEERFGHFAGGRRISGIEPLPFHRNVEPSITEIKPPPNPIVSKDNVIPLATPNANLGAKRKAVTPPKVGPNRLPLMGKSKKPREEWSCAICQVSATSEHILNEHLQGKKHKAKEAALRAQKEGKNFGIGLIPKETLPKPQQREPPSNQKVKNAESSKKIVTPAKGKKGNPKKNDAEMNGGDGSKKKYTKPAWHCASNYKFWCEMCETGADAEIVMEGHKMGKKHQYRLQQLKKKGGGGAEVLATPSVEVDQKVNGTGNGAALKGVSPEKVDGGVEGSKKKDTKPAWQRPAWHHAGNYKFWCEMCDTGADAEVIMEGHKMGKGHQNRLQQLKMNGAAGERSLPEKVDRGDESLGSESTGDNDSGW